MCVWVTLGLWFSERWGWFLWQSVTYGKPKGSSPLTQVADPLLSLKVRRVYPQGYSWPKWKWQDCVCTCVCACVLLLSLEQKWMNGCLFWRTLKAVCFCMQMCRKGGWVAWGCCCQRGRLTDTHTHTWHSTVSVCLCVWLRPSEQKSTQELDWKDRWRDKATNSNWPQPSSRETAIVTAH